MEAIVSPARSQASPAVQDRLAAVAARRAEAREAWEAWNNRKRSSKRPAAAAGEKTRIGAALHAEKRADWERVAAERRRAKQRRRDVTDRELREQAAEMYSMRMERHEARLAATAAATRLRRLENPPRLKVLRRQLAQLCDLDESPLHNQQRRRTAQTRQTPAQLVAEYRRKRDTYLGPRVRATSSQLLGRRSQPDWLKQPGPKRPPAVRDDAEGQLASDKEYENDVLYRECAQPSSDADGQSGYEEEDTDHHLAHPRDRNDNNYEDARDRPARVVVYGDEDREPGSTPDDDDDDDDDEDYEDTSHPEQQDEDYEDESVQTTPRYVAENHQPTSDDDDDDDDDDRRESTSVSNEEDDHHDDESQSASSDGRLEPGFDDIFDEDDHHDAAIVSTSGTTTTTFYEDDHHPEALSPTASKDETAANNDEREKQLAAVADESDGGEEEDRGKEQSSTSAFEKDDDRRMVMIREEPEAEKIPPTVTGAADSVPTTPVEKTTPGFKTTVMTSPASASESLLLRDEEQANYDEDFVDQQANDELWSEDDEDRVLLREAGVSSGDLLADDDDEEENRVVDSSYEADFSEEAPWRRRRRRQ